MEGQRDEQRRETGWRKREKNTRTIRQRLSCRVEREKKETWENFPSPEDHHGEETGGTEAGLRGRIMCPPNPLSNMDSVQLYL